VKKSIHTDQAPTVVGPYSQAIQSGNLVFLSGQIATSPNIAGLIQGSFSDEVEQIMKNITAVLAEAGLNLSNVVKTTIFLIDLSNYKEFNEIYGRYFDDTPPARSAVGVKELPLDARVEIEVIACKD
jgi:2-iminobutanoate/2-iminopropanoate deaminase